MQPQKALQRWTQFDEMTKLGAKSKRFPDLATSDLNGENGRGRVDADVNCVDGDVREITVRTGRKTNGDEKHGWPTGLDVTKRFFSSSLTLRRNKL